MKLPQLLGALLLLISASAYSQTNDFDTTRSSEAAINTGVYELPKVDVQPQFPGGEGAMMKFLAKYMRYPEESRDNGIQGTVVTKFVVNTQGKIEDVSVVRGVAPDLDEEAIRVVKLMPNWSPGSMKGEKVKVLYHLPVKFVQKGYVAPKAR